MIDVSADGVRSSRTVFMFSFDWEALATFFADMSDSWRGWDGERSWNSIEHDLSITARSDDFGHCHLEFTVRDGPNYSWETRIGGFSIDGGEDMSRVARSIREWSSG